MSNFPGNPYDGDGYETTNDGESITEAIKLLAFEVRTLNLQIISRPVVLEGVSPDMMRKIQAMTAGTDAQIRERLGIQDSER